MRSLDAVDFRVVYDTIVIGSGFGGSMIAHELVNAGERVLMLERGDWVERGPENWAPEGVGMLTPYYSTDTPYRRVGGPEGTVGSFNCVGGPSVFYGGVSLRFRAEDFEYEPEIAAGSGAEWPYRYAELEPYYTRAEEILGIAGEAGSDPTEPPRSAPYAHPPAEISPIARMIGNAASELGLHPFRLPLAINYRRTWERAKCRACSTCDGFACAVAAKNDLATSVLPNLIRRGLLLKPNTVAVRLLRQADRIAAVECVDKDAGTSIRYRARRFVLSAGALASPHLLLASKLQDLNPASRLVGRYLMRHRNTIVFGVFPRMPHRARSFHKQLGIHDFYFGHPSVEYPRRKLGGLQQIATPPPSLVRAHLPKLLGYAVTPGIGHLTGLLVMAEDQPREENHVAVDWAAPDRFGLPQLLIHHQYTPRDRAASRALVRKAREILRRAGARFFYVHEIDTFSHAVGTVRMGAVPGAAPLTAEGRFRGVENLFVADGSFMPTSAGVNPSLTIAANALRTARFIIGDGRDRTQQGSHRARAPRAKEPV